MTKTMEVYDGQNLIEIESDGYSECFKVNCQISSIIWRTYYHYYAVSKEQNGMGILKANFPELDANNDKTKTFEDAEKLMKLFSNGKYELTIQELIHGRYEVANDNSHFNESHDGDEGFFTYCIYTETDLIAFTKPYSDIDYKIVEGYKYEILKNKKKPLIIVFDVWEFGEDSFIIDGHHKLLAYRDLCINPNILRITKIEPKPNIHNNLIGEYQNIMNESEVKHYKRWTTNA